AIKGVKKILTGTSDISVAEGIKFAYPKGFTRLNEKGKIAFTKHNIRLDIESFTIPVQAVSSGIYALILSLLQSLYKLSAPVCQL
ncbi:MAG: hypothetical protein Q619_VDC00591G0002, partial [Veillonella dispar DORA_11]